MFSEFILGLLWAYTALGCLLGLAFILIGLGQVDPAVRGPMPLFRLLMFPGAALLWPLVLRRWWRLRRT